MLPTTHVVRSESAQDKDPIHDNSVTICRREAEIHFAMRHANIVEVIAFSIGNEANPPCLVMELMDESLYDLLGVSLYPTLTFGAAMGVIQDICVVRYMFRKH